MKLEVIASGKRHVVEAEAGSNLMECLRKADLLEGAECGGRGVCGKCVVAVHSGEFDPVEKGANFRRPDGKILSCLSLVKEDAVIEVPSSKDDINRKVRLPNLRRDVDYPDGPVKKLFLQLEKPSLRDQQSDLERILARVGRQVSFPYSLLPELPNILRSADFAVTAVVVDDELIAVEPGDTTALSYGFILDVGTTTVAIYLADMKNGDVIDAAGIANPQRGFGADVLSRITAAATVENRREMQTLTLDGIAEAMQVLLTRQGVDPARVYTVIMVGNTTMSHLFLGVDPANLAMAPFIPCYRSRTVHKGAALRLPVHPEAHVHVLPNISGYVGSDTMGVAMATKLWELDGVSVAVDIGTNGEILLSSKGEVWACSAAAGPAFEGSHIKQGMRAGEGAVEKVTLENDAVNIQVIGKSAPVGICGSGLIDAVAELVRVGLLEPTGRFVNEKSPAFAQPLARRLRTGADGIREFVLVYAGEHRAKEDIAVTLKDVRELQLAKAAIAAGIEVLLKEAGIEDASKIDRLFLAGAFGNYLDREKAVALGLFPGVSVDKIVPVGNAAAEGAGLCLLSTGERAASDDIATRIHPVELSARTDFNDLWVRCIGFPKPETL